ncbi:augurin-A-like [Mastacembelus armatus]|uniref:Cytoplasmic protein NCK2-like n=1 Tax=Mastacembelus armatus TaxID=205130 RepID=A0A3Q3NCP0_9TELE|nr:augurin-A-like [Mastacembelus armatus]XP_026157157.1 augurin-A-like [Mastacembelus armatus]XP_026157158.1 augurin-A-like [Mastacembelus armatus]
MKVETVGALLLLLLCCQAAAGGKLQQLLHKHGSRETGTRVLSAAPDKANEFLSAARRSRRNIWDRSRPDVQQWIQQFVSMGYDEARLEADLSYWMDQWRSSDQGRQHHYDENAAVGPRDATAYRHGANVNYDYY